MPDQAIETLKGTLQVQSTVLILLHNGEVSKSRPFPTFRHLHQRHKYLFGNGLLYFLRPFIQQACISHVLCARLSSRCCTKTKKSSTLPHSVRSLNNVE